LAYKEISRPDLVNVIQEIGFQRPTVAKAEPQAQIQRPEPERRLKTMAIVPDMITSRFKHFLGESLLGATNF